MEDMECTRAWISQWPEAEQCGYATTACSGDANPTVYVDFVGFFYCQINQNYPLIIFLSTIFAVICIHALQIAVDIYLAPALEVVRQKMKLSEALAGVTLVSLANGASDVITGIVAGGNDAGGMDIAVGGMLGCALFSLTMVLAGCVHGSGSVQSSFPELIRDNLFIIGSVLYFFAIAAIGPIYVYETAVFFVLYIVYVLVVVYQDKKQKITRDSCITAEKDHMSHAGSYIDTNNLLIKYEVQPGEVIDHEEEAGPMRSRAGTHKSVIDDLMPQSHYASILLKNHGDIVEEGPKNPIQKVIHYYSKVWEFVFDLTMPAFESEKYNKWIALFPPVLGTLLVIWQTGLLDSCLGNPYLWIPVGITAAILEVAVLINFKHNIALMLPTTMSIITFVISCMWVQFLITCFMDVLGLWQVVSGLPLTFLSLTILALCNSLNDLFVVYAVARAGHGNMAVNGVFGGQLFNILLGFGAALFRTSLRGPITLNIFSGSQTGTLTIILVACLVGSQIVTFFLGASKSFKLGNFLKKSLVMFYFAFFVGVTLFFFVFSKAA